MFCKDCDLRIGNTSWVAGGVQKKKNRQPPQRTRAGSAPPPPLYHLQPPTPALIIGLAPLPTPTPSPSVKPRILLRHWSRLRTRRRSSSVGPSASKTCNLAEGWCLTPNRPRPLMSIRWRYWPFVTHDWAARGVREGRRQFSIRLRAPAFFRAESPVYRTKVDQHCPPNCGRKHEERKRTDDEFLPLQPFRHRVVPRERHHREQPRRLFLLRSLQLQDGLVGRPTGNQPREVVQLAARRLEVGRRRFVLLRLQRPVPYSLVYA